MGGVQTIITIIGVLLIIVLLVRFLTWRPTLAPAVGPPFVVKPLLNKSEQKLHRALNVILPDLMEPGYHLMAQVSLGEIIRSPDPQAFYRINARRADFAIFDPNFMPVATIEYQGDGHWGWSAEAEERAREGDRIKRQSLAAAGVLMIEIPARWNRVTLRSHLKAKLRNRRHYEAL